MPELLALFSLLSLPILAFLFAGLRKRRRVEYPHELLSGDERKNPSWLLFRTLRKSFDLAIDAAIALVVSYAILSPPPPGKTAYVIDASASMLKGFPGSRPLDRALEAMAGMEDEIAFEDLYVLGFSLPEGRSRLYPFPEAARGQEPLESARLLMEAIVPGPCDPEALKELKAEGYADILFLTDLFPLKTKRMRVMELGVEPSGWLYPATVRYRPSSESWIVSVRSEGRDDVSILKLDTVTGLFAKPDPRTYTISTLPAGFELGVPSPGRWLVSTRESSFVIDLPESRIDAWAEGPVSERVLASIPLLSPTTHANASLILGDGPPNGRAEIVTTIVEREALDRVLLDPGLSLCKPVALGGARSGSTFILGKEGAANPDVATAFLSLVQSSYPPFYETRPSPGCLRVEEREGQLFSIYPDGERALIYPMSEREPTKRPGIFDAGPRRDAGLWVIVALGTLLAIKLVLKAVLDRVPS